MTRHWPAFVATVAVAAAAPAFAQDRPPPPAWADPQVVDGPPGAGAPFAAPPPGAYPLPGPLPMPPGAILPEAPQAWGPGSPYPFPGPPGPCGCAAPAYAFTWVPLQIRTNYLYSPAIERVREVPEEHVVYREAVETRTVPVRAARKYVKTTRPVKLTKGRKVRATK